MNKGMPGTGTGTKLHKRGGTADRKGPAVRGEGYNEKRERREKMCFALQERAYVQRSVVGGPGSSVRIVGRMFAGSSDISPACIA